MLNVATHNTKLLLGSLKHGSDLRKQITRICTNNHIRTALLRGCGHLSSLELAEYSLEKKDYLTTFSGEGNFSLISLEGNISKLGDTLVINAFAICSWQEDGETKVVAGHLQSATVITVEFSLLTANDIVMLRSMDEETGLPLWKGFKPITPEGRINDPWQPPAPADQDSAQPGIQAQAAPSPTMTTTAQTSPAPTEAASTGPAQVSSGWQAAIAKSEEQESLVVEEREIRKGDVLIHPKFGRCKVLKVDEDDRAIIRNESGNRITLSLSVLKPVFHNVNDAGHQVFHVKVRRNR